MFSSDATAFTSSGSPVGLPEGALKGTTTVGIVCRDGVVLATERRATLGGGFIANKVAQKLFKIDDHIGMTIAGWVGDAQTLVRYLRAEVNLYRLRRAAPITVEGSATMLANILSGNRMMPYLAWVLLGGVDAKGNHLYSVDPAGGSIADSFVSVGSGSSIAYGVLEEACRDGMALSEGVDVALRALTAAMKRDSNSGDGYLLAAISEKEYREYSDDEIRKRLSKLKLG
ncbi:MAG: archaeal proteasome endopeptidase complex subunit beta [Euryarchaeota archaeon]|nr:archaeal proteasome endopeptidase complex subunit beta [Euryarchaeota archaeon]MDE1880940.1 archaeal proteasome endopeptidase complex subunit beta [Euryarchaeota archaeon]MDE2046103.1 archaeal proteasome endopeptidase complex subunit beta [Thermoplasmata archaeon]